jgi:hypothetical protein
VTIKQRKRRHARRRAHAAGVSRAIGHRKDRRGGVMSWIAFVLIAYLAIDRVFTVAIVGRSIEITPAYAVASLISSAFWVWAILALAGVA